MTKRRVGLQADKKTGGLKTASTANEGLERLLMEMVHQRWHGVLQEACKYSSIALEFFAALIASESAGTPVACRFEPGVFKHLQAVRDGCEPRYGSIHPQDLHGFDDEDLRGLASSWGLTQIMGYHTLSWERPPADLLDPQFNLDLAVRLGAHFIEAFQLDVRRDGGEYAELFRCWNTGQPCDNPKTARIEGQTHDPKYVEKGLARMEIYKGLATRDSGLGATAPEKSGVRSQESE